MSAGQIGAHYGRAGLLAAIEAALRADGKDPAHLSPGDLAAVDQFHARGRHATVDLAQRANVQPGECVLDAGGGFGGAARLLAAEYGCQVSVLDLTAEYIEAGEALTRATGQSAQVSFRQGSVTAMPFTDGTFDCVFTQHVAMNVADKPAFYAECRRVLRPGGRLALHDVMAGAGEAVFPVPWAREPSASFLLPPDTVRALIEAAGFRLAGWSDESALAGAWFQKAAARVDAGRAPATQLLPLLFGPLAPVMAANFTRNILEQRVVIVQAVFEAV